VLSTNKYRFPSKGLNVKNTVKHQTEKPMPRWEQQVREDMWRNRRGVTLGRDRVSVRRRSSSKWKCLRKNNNKKKVLAGSQ
jgi:hypothetical protein